MRVAIRMSHVRGAMSARTVRETNIDLMLYQYLHVERWFALQKGGIVTYRLRGGQGLRCAVQAPQWRTTARMHARAGFCNIHV